MLRKISVLCYLIRIELFPSQITRTIPESRRLKPHVQMIGFALSLPIMKPLMKPITTPDKIPISIATGKPKLIVCTVIIPPTAMVSGMDISVMLPEYVMKISPGTDHTDQCNRLQDGLDIAGGEECTF